MDEELSRLVAHLSEIKRILKRGGQADKRLDFLMQELTAESQHPGSNRLFLGTIAGLVELKVLIEQMREQIQNIGKLSYRVTVAPTNKPASPGLFIQIVSLHSNKAHT